MPRVPGPVEEHDLPLRSRDVSDVRGQDERVPDLQEDRGEEDPPLLAAAVVLSKCDSLQNMY